MKFVSSIIKLCNRTAYEVTKHAPEILVGTGILSGITGTILACKETTKAEEILSETTDKLQKIESVHKEYSDDVYSESDYNKDRIIVYTQTGIKLAKTYAPAAAFIAASIVCPIAAFGIMKHRNAALASAVVAIASGFSRYRNQVKLRYGDDVDRDIYNGTTRFTSKVKEVNEATGKTETKKVETTIVDPNLAGSPYMIYYDDSFKGHQSDDIYNEAFIDGMTAWANNTLTSRHYLFLNEVYARMGLEDIPEYGQVVGWIDDPNEPNRDGHVDLGAEFIKETVDGKTETKIILNPNVDGPILDIYRKKAGEIR